MLKGRSGFPLRPFRIYIHKLFDSIAKLFCPWSDIVLHPSVVVLAYDFAAVRHAELESRCV